MFILQVNPLMIDQKHQFWSSWNQLAWPKTAAGTGRKGCFVALLQALLARPSWVQELLGFWRYCAVSQTSGFPLFNVVW